MTRYGTIFLLIILGGPVLAAENMSFSGTLIDPPPCSINSGGEVEVKFGDRIGVSKVDGVNYLQPVNYRITCIPELGTEVWNMTLEIVGNAPEYDSAAIQSDVDDLAIRLMQNNERFILNKPLPIILNAPPTLTAVPVKRPGTTLKEGPFEATATLLVGYQ